MGAYVQYVAFPSKKRYAAIIISFALGLMAKPMLVTLPFVLLLLDYWPLNRLTSSPYPGRGTGQRDEEVRAPALIVEKLPLFALTVVSSIVTFWRSTPGIQLRRSSSYRSRFEWKASLVGYVGYLAKMIWPMRLAPFYPLYADHLPVWQVAGSAMLLVGLTALAWALRRRCSIPSGRMALVPGDARAGHRYRAGGTAVVGRPLHVRPAYRHFSGAGLDRRATSWPCSACRPPSMR